jgi:hypothetical protein
MLDSMLDPVCLGTPISRTPATHTHVPLPSFSFHSSPPLEPPLQVVDEGVRFLSRAGEAHLRQTRRLEVIRRYVREMAADSGGATEGATNGSGGAAAAKKSAGGAGEARRRIRVVIQPSSAPSGKAPAGEGKGEAKAAEGAPAAAAEAGASAAAATADASPPAATPAATSAPPPAAAAEQEEEEIVTLSKPQDIEFHAALLGDLARWVEGVRAWGAAGSPVAGPLTEGLGLQT